jgi:hypothetical protein
LQNYAAMGLCTTLNGATGGSQLSDADRRRIKSGIRDDDGGLAALALRRGAVGVRSIGEAAPPPDEDEDLVEGTPDVDIKGLGVGRKIGRVNYLTDTGAAEPSLLIKEIMLQAASAVKVLRKSSEQEVLFLTALEGKYGDAYDRMARDKRLNPHLISAGQLKRKFSVLVQNSELEE